MIDTKSATGKLIAIFVTAAVLIIIAVSVLTYRYCNTRLYMQFYLIIIRNFLTIVFALTFLVVIITVISWYRRVLRQMKHFGSSSLEIITKINKHLAREQYSEIKKLILDKLRQLTGGGESSILVLNKDRKLFELDAGAELKNCSFRLEDNIVKLIMNSGHNLPLFEIDDAPLYLEIPEPANEDNVLIIIPSIYSLRNSAAIFVSSHTMNKLKVKGPVRDMLAFFSLVYHLIYMNNFLKHRVNEVSIFDETTGNYRYNYFDSFLKKEIERAERYQKCTSLIYLEIDDPEDYTFEADDDVFIHVSKIIRDNIRMIDLVFKDDSSKQFAIILTETDNQQAVAVMERIQAVIKREKFYISSLKKKVGLTVSQGLATYPVDTTLQANLVEAARQALQSAKASGNTYKNYSDLF